MQVTSYFVLRSVVCTQLVAAFDYTSVGCRLVLLIFLSRGLPWFKRRENFWWLFLSCLHLFDLSASRGHTPCRTHLAELTYPPGLSAGTGNDELVKKRPLNDSSLFQAIDDSTRQGIQRWGEPHFIVLFPAPFLASGLCLVPEFTIAVLLTRFPSLDDSELDSLRMLHPPIELNR